MTRHLTFRGGINVLTRFLLNGTQVTPTAAEINKLAAVTGGIAAANLAAVLGANKNLDEFHTAALYLGAAAGTQVSATATDLNKLTSRNTVFSLIHNVTAAEVNTGHTILADAAGVIITPVSVKMRALGGAAGGATSVDLTDTVAAAIASFPVAILTQNAMAGEYSANVVSTGIGVAQTSGKGLKVIKAGNDLTTATSVDVIVSYTIS